MAVTPQEVAAGGTATLSWQSQRATAVEIDNGVGRVAASGQVSVAPVQSTTYRATATGPGGTASTSTALAVTGNVSVTLTADQQSVAAGQSVTLAWSSANASTVVIEPGIGTVAASGTMTVTPSQTTTYTATANGPGGVSAVAAATVQVFTQPPAISAAADRTTITAGELATLSWNSTNAAEVEMEPEVEIEGVDSFPLNGSTTLSPPQTTTYVLTATNPLGSAQVSVTITVDQVTPTVTLAVDRASILPGESAVLSWSSTHADSITVDQGVGSVSVPSGTQSVTPAATTTYTATATGPGGTQTASATVTVTPPTQLGVSLVAEPATIPAGQSATLTWDSQNAASVSISNCAACSGLSGSAQVTPAATTTYTATATDSGGATRTASATITVVPAGGLNQKIKHIIFYMQENRSFDHYFGKLGEYRQRVHGLPASDIDAPDYTKVFTDINGARYRLFHTPTVCTDNTSPGWNESHFFAHRKDGAWQMDFWLKQQTDSQGSTIDPRYTRSLGYYTEQELPYYYELATQFATSDRMFGSAMAPTIPNRMYLFAGTSFGHIRPDTDLQNQNPDKRWPQLTFFEWMTQHGVNWRYYYQDSSVYLEQYNVWTRGIDPASTDTVAKTTVGRVRNISEFYNILAQPNADDVLPAVIFLEQPAQLMLNEHPSNKWGMQPGVANTKKILDALMASPAWKSSVFILMYDEGGGFYDHVPPYTTPDPDGIAPIFHSTDLKQGPPPESLPYNFTQSGFRVPFIVVSPWVKKGFVSHTPREHTSVLAFIESRFGIPALPSGRDRFYPTDDFLEFFDFDNPSWLTPPPLPEQPWKNQAMVNGGAAPAPADPNAGACNKALQVAPQVP
jgi:phospholipase C